MGMASPGAAAPELPKRKRKSPGAPTVERPRLLAGTAGLARLGHSLVARSVHSSYTIGVVSEWCQPWFTVSYADGSREPVRAHELAPVLIFSPSDFFDPTLFFFDFGIFNPLRVPGWVAAQLPRHLQGLHARSVASAAGARRT